MTRAAIAVRTAARSDVPAVAALCEQATSSGSGSVHAVGSSARPLARPTEEVRARLEAVLEDPRQVLLVACLEDRVVGMCTLQEAPTGPFGDSLWLQMTYSVVDGGYRRRGVGRALVAAAATAAETKGIDQVAVNVPPTGREAQRFYARLGFAPVFVTRAAPVAVLRRRLATPERRALSSDITRRRMVRRNRGIPAVGSVGSVGSVRGTSAAS